jgi:hypothetical protein
LINYYCQIDAVAICRTLASRAMAVSTVFGTVSAAVSGRRIILSVPGWLENERACCPLSASGARRHRRRAHVDALPRILRGQHSQPAHAPGLCPLDPLRRGLNAASHRREEPAPYPVDHDRQTARPLARSRRRWIRKLGRAMPSPRHASGDSFSSRSTLQIRIVAPQPATARVRRPPESAACFPAGSAAPRPVAATHPPAAGIPHGPWRARSDPCTPRCGRTC